MTQLVCTRTCADALLRSIALLAHDLRKRAEGRIARPSCKMCAAQLIANPLQIGLSSVFRLIPFLSSKSPASSVLASGNRSRVQGHPAAIHPEWPDANTSGQVSFVASQPRVPVHARPPTLSEHGIEAALQGPLGVTDMVGFVAKPGDEHTALIASAVSPARRRGYAELEHGVAPGKSVRHSLGRCPKTVTHTRRKCLAQPPVAEAVGGTSERTA
jgi:hypothetical protein